MSCSHDMLPVAILAGGLATRLRPLTETDSEGAGRGGRRAVHRPPARASARARASRSVVLCVGHLGEQVEASVGDGARIRPASRRTRSTARRCSAPAARCGRRCRCSASVLRALRRFLPADATFARSQRRFRRRAASPALMTVLRNDDRWDRSNVAFRDGQVVEYDKRARGPEMRLHRLRLGHTVARQCSSRTRRATAFDLADVYHELVARRAAGRLRGPRALLRDRLARRA